MIMKQAMHFMSTKLSRKVKYWFIYLFIYLFICRLFSDTDSESIALNNMISE
jgi:hypothetical protein